MADPLTLSAAQQETLQHIVRHFPGLVEALREHVAALIDAVVPTVQGVVMTETRVDDLLGTLVERIVAGGAPEEREATEGDALAGAMVMLVTRHLLAEARADAVRRLVSVRAN